MPRRPPHAAPPDGSEAFLSPWTAPPAARVRRRLRAAARSALDGTALAAHVADWIAAGGLLRAHVVDALGRQNGLPAGVRTLLATAVELVHAGSLLHDDVLDESPMRRDRPALWADYGVKAALLAGDALIVEGVRLLQCPPRIKTPVDWPWLARELVQAARATCQGELLQDFPPIGAPHRPPEDIAARKTGPLFAWAAIAALAGLPETARRARLAALRRRGIALGVAYQALDDRRDAR